MINSSPPEVVGKEGGVGWEREDEDQGEEKEECYVQRPHKMVLSHKL